MTRANIIGKNDAKKLRVKKEELFLKENGALVASIGPQIDIRNFPSKILDSLLQSGRNLPRGK